MSFQSLKVDELKSIAEFFQKDIVAVDESKPTKKELLVALASDADGADPVSWEDYNNIYLPAKANGQTTDSDEEEDDDDAKDAPVAPKEKPKKVDTSNHVLIKYERKNPTYEVVGYVFTKRHPFASVPAEVASHLVRNVEGFRLAMPDEVTDYYG